MCKQASSLISPSPTWPRELVLVILSEFTRVRGEAEFDRCHAVGK
jgi:hypothetical protein